MNVYLVHNATIQANDGINGYMAEILIVMKEKIMKYWPDYSIFISSAVVLDPHIKFKFIEYCYYEIYNDDEAHRRLDAVRSALYNLFREYHSGVVANEHIATPGFASIGGIGAFS